MKGRGVRPLRLCGRALGTAFCPLWAPRHSLRRPSLPRLGLGWVRWPHTSQQAPQNVVSTSDSQDFQTSLDDAAALLPELADIVQTMDGPVAGSDLVDFYEQFLSVRATQEKIRPVLERLAFRWARSDVQLTPQQLCAIWAVHNRLHCFPMPAFRALGLQLIRMDPSQLQVEDVAELLSIHKNYFDHIQDREIGKSMLFARMVERFRKERATSPVFQVLLRRAEEIPDEDFDIHDTVNILRVMVRMHIKRPALQAKLLRRVSELRDVIEGRIAIQCLYVVAATKDHTEESVELIKMLVRKTEDYVQKIRDAEDRLARLREANPKAESSSDPTWDRREELIEQRKAARLAAQDMTNTAMSVGEGYMKFTYKLVEGDRRLVAEQTNRIAKAAQLQAVALQTDPDRYVGPPFMIREVVACLQGLGHAVDAGEKVGDPELANITGTHTALIEFTCKRALDIPSELYAPRDINHILGALGMMMWREEELFHKLALQTVVTESMWSPLQTAEVIRHMEYMKVFNTRFNKMMYWESYVHCAIDIGGVLGLMFVLITFVILVHELNDYPEEEIGEGWKRVL